MPTLHKAGISNLTEIERLRLEVKELKLQKEELSRQLQMYQNIIHNFPNGAVALLDDEFKYAVAGGELFSKLGVSPTSIISKTPMEIDTHAINDVIVPLFSQMKEEAVVSTENPVGKDRIVMQHVKLTNTILDRNRKSVLIVAMDISKQKIEENIIERSEAKFRTLFENSPMGIILTDENGFVTDVNHAYLEMTGLDGRGKDKYVNILNVKHLFILKDAGVQHFFIDLYEKKKAFSVEAKLRGLTGKEFFLRYVAVPILDREGMVKGAIINVENIASRLNTEMALKASEEQYRKTINSIDDFIFVLDHNFEIVLINETFEKWTAVFDVPQNAVGRSFSELFEQIEPTIRRNYQLVFDTGEGVCFEHIIRRKGLEYWTEIKILPVKAANGSVFQVLIMIKDISERKKAEFEMRLNEQRLSALLDFAQQKFSAVGEIVDYALEQCLQLTGSEIGVVGLVNQNGGSRSLLSWRGVSPEVQVPQKYHDAVFRSFFYDPIQSGVPVLVNQVKDCPERTALPIELKPWTRFASIPIFEEQKLVAVVGLANKPYDYDQLDVKQIQLLMESVWKLKSQIEANKQLKHSEQRLRELNATKDKFFSIIAHDLASPFNSLLGFSDLLYANAQTYDREKISKIALTLKRSAETGYALLENLLEWSRAQTGRLKPSPEVFDLCAMIHNIVVGLESKSLEKDIVVDFDDKRNLYVKADPNMINTVLRNIINNSIKFSYIGGNIQIVVDQHSDGAVVHISDSGMGIDEADKEHIFSLDSFSKQGTANEKGTGLGLLLCREFIEKNGGRIWFESKKGVGSKFSFSLASGSV